MAPISDIFEIQDIDRDILERERDRALGFLECEIPDLHLMEVGSTAVEGLIGKCDIDLVASVPIDDFDRFRKALDGVLSRDPNQLSSDQYQAYIFPSDLDVKIQLTIKGGPYDKFEEFLNALKEDPKRVSTYNDIKLKWNGRPMEDYRRAKAEFIEFVLSSRTS